MFSEVSATAFGQSNGMPVHAAVGRETMRESSRNGRARWSLALAGGVGLTMLGACAGSPTVEALGETGVRVRADQPLETSAALQPEAERYCRQFGRIAEPAGAQTDATGQTWYRYNCLPE